MCVESHNDLHLVDAFYFITAEQEVENVQFGVFILSNWDCILRGHRTATSRYIVDFRVLNATELSSPAILTSSPRPADQVSALFGNHYNRSVSIARRNLWHYRSIDHSQIPYPVHSQLVINDGHRIPQGSHLARTSLMILSTGVLSNGTLPVFLKLGTC